MAFEKIERVTGAQLAEWLGISSPAVTALAKRGTISKTARGYPLKASVRKYCGHLRAALLGRGGADTAATSARERARLAKEQADGVALKNAKLRGAVLDATAVEREWSDILRGVRAGVLAVPSRVGARLPHLAPCDISAIDREVRDALAELGRDDKGEERHM
jgi:phage terminase Nu1 subunit (DNA packaging protein)